jgi:hypothetical protein
VQPQPSTLGSLLTKIHLESGSVADAVRSTCGLQRGASHPLQKGFGLLNQTRGHVLLMHVLLPSPSVGLEPDYGLRVC